MGEVFSLFGAIEWSLIGLFGLASALVGWAFKSMTGAGRKQSRRTAQAIDRAVEDANHLRRSVDKKDAELRELRVETLRLKRHDSGNESSTREQVVEINKLKSELGASNKALRDNQAEFNDFRTDKKVELSGLRKELAKYEAGGTSNSERLADANDTVSALRSAVRENDTVIDSLRARIKESDSTVENLRNQLKNAQSSTATVESVRNEFADKVERLTKERDENQITVDKQKREYDHMLATKNHDVKNLQRKLDDLSGESSNLKKREVEHKNSEGKIKSEITELKRVISDRDTALSNAKRQITELDSKLAASQNLIDENINSQTTSKLKTKAAEIAALNDMLKDSSKKRDELQGNFDKIKAEVKEKDTRIESLRSELDQVVENRNSVSSQLGELQTQGNFALEKLQEDLNNLANTRDEYKGRIDQLHGQVADLKREKDDLRTSLTKEFQNTGDALKKDKVGLENDKLKLQQETQRLKQQSDSKYTELQQERAKLIDRANAKEVELNKKNVELANTNISMKRQLNALEEKLGGQDSQLHSLRQEISGLNETRTKLASQLKDKETQLTDTHGRLQKEESESQRLNSALSDTEALRLSLTERDAQLRKTQIELQDIKAGGSAQKSVSDMEHKVDSLMGALQQRDEEISRLNEQVTTNRLQSKEHQSNIQILNDEKAAQKTMISTLEKQAESTLQLHTKIAAQSTEIEDLRARLFEQDHTGRPASDRQMDTNAKPRVFVRPDTEALAGVSVGGTGGGYQSGNKPTTTLDGKRVKRADGNDDLSILPGVTHTIAGAFARNNVVEFEQIAQWSEREVAHYAERCGVSVQRAKKYNWPKAARQILSGNYRTDTQKTD